MGAGHDGRVDDGAALTGSHQSGRARVLPVVAGALLLGACLLVLYRSEIADGGAWLTGDRFDGRIADALQLHWFNVFAGREPWRGPLFFQPSADTLGYNDGYLLFGVLFSAAHALGADIFLSAELAGVPFRIAGFVAIALLAREALGLELPFALLAASLGVLSNAVYLQQVHVQLLAVYLAPVLALLLWRAGSHATAGRRVAATGYASCAAVEVGAWALTAFYTLWFAALFALVAGLAVLARRPRALPAFLRLVAGAPFRVPFVVLAVGLVPAILVYAPTLADTGGHPWSETFTYTIRPADLVHVGPGNLVAGLLGLGSTRFDEHAVGLPPLLWLLAAAGVALAFGRDRRAIHLPLALGFALTLGLGLRFGHHTAWRLVYAVVPGAGAVRVVCRVMLLLSLVAAMLAAAALAILHRARRLPAWVTAALALLLLVEEVNTTQVTVLPRQEEDAFFAHIRPPPPGCTDFVVARRREVAPMPPGPQAAAFLAAVDAMVLAERDGLPTPQGVASFTPPGFDPFAGIDEAALLGGGGRPVCGVDLVSGDWQVVTPRLVEFAPGTVVSFTDADRRADGIAAGGWDPGEPGGRWTEGPRATLVFRRSGTGPLRLALRARVGFGDRGHPSRVVVLANGRVVARWPNDPALVDHPLRIPADAIGPDGIVELRLEPHDLSSPAALGMAPDARRLGVYLTSIAAR